MINKLRIGMVTPFPPSKTTLNEYGYHLSKHFRSKEDVEELVLFVEEGFEYKGSEHQKISFSPCWNFNSKLNPFKIISAVRRSKPDVVIINLQFLLFGDKKVAAALGLLLPFMLRVFGYKNIVLLHNIMEEVDLEKAGITKNKLLASVFSFIGNMLTRFILASNLVGVTIEKYIDVLKQKYKAKNVVLLPHGTFEIPPTPSFELPEGPLQVMTFGKFGTYKKVEILIDAVEIVRKSTDLDIKVVIAGTDNPNVPGYLDNVKKSYVNVGQLEFTGYVAEEDVPRIFSEAAVVVFPYTSTTGSSGVLHQAGSYGKAAILPLLGDLAHLVQEEGYRGEFFEPDDAQSLADAIKKLLLDPKHRVKIEKANFRAASSLGLSDITEWYLIHIRKLLQ